MKTQNQRCRCREAQTVWYNVRMCDQQCIKSELGGLEAGHVCYMTAQDISEVVVITPLNL